MRLFGREASESCHAAAFAFFALCLAGIVILGPYAIANRDTLYRDSQTSFDFAIYTATLFPASVLLYRMFLSVFMLKGELDRHEMLSDWLLRKEEKRSQEVSQFYALPKQMASAGVALQRDESTGELLEENPQVHLEISSRKIRDSAKTRLLERSKKRIRSGEVDVSNRSSKKGGSRPARSNVRTPLQTVANSNRKKKTKLVYGVSNDVKELSPEVTQTSCGLDQDLEKTQGSRSTSSKPIVKNILH